MASRVSSSHVKICIQSRASINKTHQTRPIEQSHKIQHYPEDERTDTWTTPFSQRGSKNELFPAKSDVSLRRFEAWERGGGSAPDALVRIGTSAVSPNSAQGCRAKPTQILPAEKKFHDDLEKRRLSDDTRPPPNFLTTAEEVEEQTKWPPTDCNT